MINKTDVVLKNLVYHEFRAADAWPYLDEAVRYPIAGNTKIIQEAPIVPVKSKIELISYTLIARVRMSRCRASVIMF